MKGFRSATHLERFALLLNVGRACVEGRRARRQAEVITGDERLVERLAMEAATTVDEEVKFANKVADTQTRMYMDNGFAIRPLPQPAVSPPRTIAARAAKAGARWRSITVGVEGGGDVCGGRRFGRAQVDQQHRGARCRAVQMLGFGEVGLARMSSTFS